MISDQVLNPEQQRAVEHGEGPLLVIAGPGSGKTRVITQRIVHLLGGECIGAAQGGRSETAATAWLETAATPRARPEDILALTFTDKAAEEMRARVHQALPNLARLPFISTFHAFCYHVLRERHFERRLLDEIDVWIFLRRRLEQMGLEYYRKLAEPGAFLHDLNQFFSRCQDELVEPEDFEAHVAKIERDFIGRYPGLSTTSAQVQPGTTSPLDLTGVSVADLDGAEARLEHEEIQKKRELARVFRKSRELIEQAGCSSFGSLISETLRLWDREPEVLECYRTRFRHVLVDEFQDTNFVQIELLRRLVAPPYNITVVGDDDQAIYRFRGASYGAFQMFDRTFPGHETVYLERNYRSTRKILRAAYTVIARNERYHDKKALRTENPEGAKVYLLESPDSRSEAAWIADEVKRLAGQGVRLGSVAVLYRSHNYRDPLVEEFRLRDIPFNIRGLSILYMTIVRDFVAYLRLIHSPHDSISLTRVLLAPRWRFPEELALDIRRQAARDRSSIYSAIRAMEGTLFREEVQKTGWRELQELLGEVKSLSESAHVTTLFDRLIDRLGLAFLPGDRDRAYVAAFRRFLGGWEEKSETCQLAEFMEYLQYFLEAGGTIENPEPENPANAVQMMTVHAAKGLEFPVVFVLSVARQRFPHREEHPVIEFPEELRKSPPAPPDIHLQEERRLFYVAMTRACERLYVSSVAAPGRKPSVFIEDLLSDSVVTARDIERIQVTAVRVREGSTLPRARGARPYPEDVTGQRSLFEHALPSASAVHPDILSWASRPVADGLYAKSIRPWGSLEPKLRLSASMIDTYRECPMRFKFSHCYRIPTAPQAMLTFGNLMHQCVRHYFELRQKAVPAFEEIQDFYLHSWKDAGFEDSYQEEAYRKAGLDQLREFVDRHNSIAVAYEGIAFEQRFALDLGDILLEGRIDEIRPLAGSTGVSPALLSSAHPPQADSIFEPSPGRGTRSGAARSKNAGGTNTLPRVELIDYKTGRPRSQKDAERSLQLSVYALAARRELKVEPARLTFYNLTNNEPVSTVRTTRELEKAVDEIREVAARIQQRLFEPAPGFACKRCEFVPLCPAHEQAS